jgi:hypothetical protein
MKSNKSRQALAALAITIVGLFASPAQATGDGDREVVIEWSQALLTNLPPTAGLFSFRYHAMMHIAMFDAINSVERDYTPYRVQVWVVPGASAEAAAAQAAHDVLVSLIPTAQTAFDTLLQNRLAKITSWRAAQGVLVGKRVASAIIDWRTADGFEQPNIPYAPPALAGAWQPTAAGQVAGFVQFSNTEPFGILTPTQFLPAAPPFLTSAEYTAAFNQVKELGSASSTARTADQTLVARLIAGVGYSPGPFGLWVTITRDVARNHELSLIRTARAFALVTAAMNDGLQTSHTSKFIYNLWRPITAIQRAGEDLNADTLADPTWAPLITTPPYPSHSSNIACIATSAARALARSLHADAVPFNVTWTGTGGNANVTRSYTGFSALAEEAGLARVYGGIHFAFELDASHEACTKVAEFIADHYMRRR